MNLLKNIQEILNRSDKKYFKNFIVILLFIYFIHHISLWILTIFTKNLDWNLVLANWDSKLYNDIILSGYDKVNIAFYPLYPFLIKIISKLLSFNIPPHYIGITLSTILFFILNIFILKLISKNKKYPDWLIPQTKFAYFFFLYAPVSYIYHTSHTESLYLFLSFMALYLADKQWVIASILAGLCALTKNQGVLLSIAVAWLILNSQEKISDKIKKFILSGTISFSFYSIFLIYQYINFNNPFAFLAAQKNWTYITSIKEYLIGFFIVVKYHDISRFNFFAALYYYCLFIFSFTLYKKSKPIFFYIISCLLIIPLQGALINAFRYTVFLFPVLFSLGNFLSKRNIIFLVMITIFLIYLNHQMTRNYVLTRWSY